MYRNLWHTQGSLASFLFSLYINNIGPFLNDKARDIPYIGSHPIPLLLYADDAVLIARTGRGLQLLIDNFSILMNNVELHPNFGKTFTMFSVQNLVKVFASFNKAKISNTDSFSNLAILFDSEGTGNR